MTGAEITFKASADAVAVTISSLIASYKRTRTINRGQLQALQVQAEQAVRMARVHAAASLARVNIEEIAYTQRLIDSLYFDDGPALRGAMMQLEQLSLLLVEQLRGLGHA